jgi:hypothetical protein
VRVTQGVIRWAQLAEGRVAGVFLVGGSSRIPLVATLLHRALGEAPVAIDQPELVVAEGSLVGGASAAPVSAGPAPGPQTGPMPRLNADGYAPPPMAVSAPPVSGPPVSSPPISGAPVSAGRVYGSANAPVSPGLGAPVSPGLGAPVSPGLGAPVSPGPGAPSSPAMPYPAAPIYPPRPQPPQPGHAVDGRQRSAGVRALLAGLLLLLLITVPLVAGYISYRLSAGVWPPPFGR